MPSRLDFGSIFMEFAIVGGTSTVQYNARYSPEMDYSGSEGLSSENNPLFNLNEGVP